MQPKDDDDRARDAIENLKIGQEKSPEGRGGKAQKQEDRRKPQNEEQCGQNDATARGPG